MWRTAGLWALVGCGGLEGTLESSTLEAPELDSRYTLSTYVHPEARLEPGAPWLMVLDGDIHLETAAEELDRAARRGEVEPLVLVGVGNQRRRTRDYTPPPELVLDPYASEAGGGGIEPFFAWVQAEVVPRVEEELAVGGSPEARGLAGHSYGGLGTAWVATHQPGSFGRYAALSPSLWWDLGAPLEWAPPQGTRVRLHATMGSVEAPPMNVLFDAFEEHLAAEPAFEATTDVIGGYDHYTTVRPALRSALRALYPASEDR